MALKKMLRSSTCCTVFILCSLVIFTNADSSEEDPAELCGILQVEVVPGSSVNLPCSFHNDTNDWVFWRHNSHNESHKVIQLTRQGKIHFSDPRNGRVKAYYIQSFAGNYSISIYDLRESDLGSYICQYGQECFQVELNQTETAGLSQDAFYLLYLCVIGGVLILLSIGGYFIWYRTRKQTYRINGDLGTSNGTVTTGRQQRANNHQVIYENDDQMTWGSSVSNLNLNQPAAIEMKAIPGQQRAARSQALAPSPMPCHSKGCHLTPNLPQKNKGFVYNRNAFPNTGR